MSAPALITRLEQRDAGVVAHAAINGRKTLNLVDAGVLRDATAALATLLEQPELRCIVLTGRDERAFVGGADLNALAALGPATAENFIRAIHDFCAALRAAPVPVVGVLRGYCIGAGLEIAAACDFRLADRSVRCGMPEVRIGVPSVVEAALLPGLIGWGKARELMLRGHLIDADESSRIGLLQQVVDASELDALVATVANDLLAAGPRALAAQKTLFQQWEEQPPSAAIESGVAAFVQAYSNDEPQEKIAEFFAGRRAAG